MQPRKALDCTMRDADAAETGNEFLPTQPDSVRQAIAQSFEAGAPASHGVPGKGRPHQIAAVAQLIEAVRLDCQAPKSPSYLLQHAAGSGKSLTIAALVAALLKTQDASGRTFHTVLVVTDRLQLDQQLGNAVVDFVAGNGFPASTVARASSSSQLRSHLLTPPGAPGRPAVILTTIQKLASLWRNAADVDAEPGNSTAAAAAVHEMTLAGSRAAAAAAGDSANFARVLGQGRVAIIADEAHRHHGNHTSEQISDIMAAVFGGGSSSSSNGAAAAAAQQRLVITNRAAGKRKAVGAAAAAVADGGVQQQPKFVTYFGFTATPGPRALQLFGVPQQVQVDVLGKVVAPQEVAAAAAGLNGSVSSAQQQQQDPAAELHLLPATLYTPFHCYSLQQATTDGLVLDVLQRFVAVTPRFQISGLQLTQQQQLQLQQLDAASRAAAEVTGSNPGGSTGKKRISLREDLGLGLVGNRISNGTAAAANNAAAAAGVGSLAEGLLIQAASNSRQLIMTKAEDIAQRFMEAWREAAACGFTGFRAMVVVRSRQHVVWYCQELRKLLQQHHQQQIQQLLAAAADPVDLAAARAAAAGDMSPLCYGAFSGTVNVAAAEAQQLLNPTAAAAAAATAGGGRQRRVNSTTSSGWDAALAAFDAEQQLAQQQVDRDNSQAAAVMQVGRTVRRRRSTPSSSSSSSGSEYSVSEGSDQEDNTSDSQLYSSTSSDSGAEGDSAAAAAGEGECDSLTDSWAKSDSAAAAATTTLDQSQQDQQLLPDLQLKARKRPRRDASTLSCSTSNTAAAALKDGSSSGTKSNPPQQQQQLALMDDEQPESDTDSVPLLQRRQQQQQQRRQQRQATPAVPAAAAAAALPVPVSERDLNASGFSHAAARLLVVCSKFETGYDDPRLGAIFVDRALSGARAVQVLSRVNRPAPGKGSSSPAAATAVGGSSSSSNDADATAAAVVQAGFGVLVVDFVNSVGGIRDAFSQFYGATSHCTGSEAKRLRQQQTLDECLSRVLEVLQPAAARQAAAAALAQRLKGRNTSPPAAAAAKSRNDLSGSLADLNIGQVCGVVAGLQPEVQQAVEDDLGLYCNLCLKLRLEKLEFPYVFAAAVHAQLAALRQRRERAASSGRFAWMEQIITPAAAAAGAPQTDAGSLAEKRQPTSAAAAAAAGQHDVLAADTQQQGQQQLGTAAAVAPLTAAAKLQHDLQSSSVAVEVVQLEETFAGRVLLYPADTVQPLYSVKLSSHLSAAGGSNSHNKKHNSQGISAEMQVKAGRPLHEVIEAANAQLAGRFKKQVAEGLRELCKKLGQGSNNGSSSSNPVAAAAAAAAEGNRTAARIADAVPAGADSKQQQQQQQRVTEADGTPSTAAAAAAEQQHECAEGDVYTVISLLRRLQLWPVSAALLRSTQAGKQVSALAKTHPHPMVRALATQVVAEWKAVLARQAMAAAAAKASGQQQGGSSSSSGSEKPNAAAAAAAGIDGSLRGKVIGMMRDALVEHRTKVQLQQQQQDPEQQQQQQQLGLVKSNVPASEMSQLQAIAEDLEHELHKHVTGQHTGSSSGNSTRTAAAAAAAAAAAQDYKKQARMLCTGLRYPDGVAVQLLAGEHTASTVVRLDALALAPTAVQAAVAKRREEQRRSEAVWEELVSQSIGGGGTYVTADVKCPQCGERRAQVHTILSGGTYAQERQTIQKYVCKQCNFTWRSDS